MSDHGQDLIGTRYEHIELDGTRGYNALILIYAPWADWPGADYLAEYVLT